jgi:rRNA maturation RNase YbeY
MYTVDLVFLDHTRSARPAISRATALRFIRATLKGAKIPADKTIEIAVVLIGKTRMRALNKKWRKADKTTDVLAFPLSQPSYKGYTSLSLGDIFISPMIVREKAARTGLSERAQMAWTLVHGVLHLAGYDHERSPAAAKEMAALEHKILKILFRERGAGNRK